VESATLSVDATVGIACGPAHGNSAEQLLQRAEAAMYRAKRAQSRLGFFSAELEEEAPRRLVLVTALKRAIDLRAITFHYQPRIELARGAVVGVEALARWTDPVLGQIGPSTFVDDPNRANNTRSTTLTGAAATGTGGADRTAEVKPVAETRRATARTGEAAAAGNLADTGASPVVALVLASVLVAAGAALVVVMRRRVTRR